MIGAILRPVMGSVGGDWGIGVSGLGGGRDEVPWKPKSSTGLPPTAPTTRYMMKTRSPC